MIQTEGVGASGAQGNRPVPGAGAVGALCGGIQARYTRVEGGYGDRTTGVGTQ